MRSILILAGLALPLIAQVPAVTLVNTTRPGSKDFQVGDRFEISVTSAGRQPVSVRTTRMSATNWSSVIGWTDGSGHWSAKGQFEKADFGPWSEKWTVGGGLAPNLEFFVTGPCVPGGKGMLQQSGPNMALSCETAAGQQNFVTPSFGDSFRTSDGRVIPGWTSHDGSPEQRMGNLIEGPGAGSIERGDDAGALMAKTIGPNLLDDREIGNVLQIVHFVFRNLDRNAPNAKNPVATLTLLRQLANETESADLKQQIAETILFVQAI